MIPVYGTLGFDFSIQAKAKAQAALQFSTAYRQEMNASLGLAYKEDSGVSFVRSFQTSAPDIEPPSIAPINELEFKLSLEPRIEFLVYGLAGMKASVEHFGALHVVSTNPPATSSSLELGLDFTLGTAGPAFEALGIDAGLSLPIWSNTWPLSATTFAFKTHPQSRTVDAEDDVSFTCTVESPSAPTFQWFYNNKPIPGQTSRSLFLTYVNSGHAGTYFVRAMAGGKTVYSDTATLTVQTVTQENLDSDSDGIPNIHETSTGIWVSSTNRGTNPYRWDTDGDGLSDGVETNTRVYVSRSNTGTNPLAADTDSDGVNDKREIELGTDPNAPPLPPITNEFALIPAGWFQMGQDGIATPVHSVYVSAFYMGKYEVTKEEWDTVRAWGLNNGYTDLAVGNGSLASKGANHPVHSITWYDIVKWCNARSDKENRVPCYTVGGTTYKTGQNDAVVCNFTANGYRLPTEAEWEKAARGGLSGKLFPWGDASISHDRANFWNSHGEIFQTGTTGPHPLWSNNNDGVYPYSSPVGSFAPNGYGLYDMAGNMWEWCWDRYGAYTATSQNDPQGAPSGSDRVIRGGSWSNYGAAYNARCAHRLIGYSGPSGSSGDGFRLARSSVP